jgi:D-sedoheptulose 7-phosphate isomerase
MSTIEKSLDDHLLVMAEMKLYQHDIEDKFNVIKDTLARGGKIIFCGNGGSAADCQHLAAEFTGRFVRERRPLAAIALTTDTSALTCIGNDYGFEFVFSRQLSAIGNPGDMLIAISTSGNSQNIITCAKTAREMGIATLGLLGRDGGKLKDICEHVIVVPSDVTARIQEAHIFIGHIFCELIDEIYTI